jgi:Stage II sporulation protein E (SpoIIE)
MVPGRSWRAGMALGATLIGMGASLLTGNADAQASGSSPLPTVSLPGVGVALPNVGVALPSVGVALPNVGAVLPNVGVSLPGVSVSVPEVSVSVPGVSVSTPSVSVSTPEVSVSTPSAPGTGPTETPGGAGTPTSPTGGGAGASPSERSPSTPSKPGGSAVAPASGPATTSTSSPASAAAVNRITSGGAGERPQSAAPRSTRAPSHRRHLVGGSAAAGRARTGAVVLARATTARAVRGSRVAKRRASNPLDAIGRHIPLPIPVPDWSKPIILVLLLLAIWFGVRSRMAARRARRLEGQRVTLLRDVGAMQAALVPVIPARVGGLAVSVAYRPAEGPAAGGDFYDVFAPERGKIAIVLGDVAGHGHQALTQAALTRYTLRAYLQAGLEPRAVLALAGRVLADREMEHFATVAVGVYHTREGRLTYASAGHPHPILHGLQTREPVAICASPPLGWTVPTGRRQTTVSLPPGAVACFFTDGLIEARCKEELLGRERLSEILAALGPRPDAGKLLARVRAAALATPDDMAACVLVPETAGIAARTHIEELEADARALEAGHVRRFLETCQVLAPGIEQAIERASGIAAVRGTALLRVELASTTATAAVSAPYSYGYTAVAGGGLAPRPVR